MPDSATDWKARAAAVAAADGDEWDRLHDALQADWIAAYCAAFRRIAAERGWTADNIESDCLNMAREAFLVAEWGASPEQCAAYDLRECERDARNA